MIFLPFHHCCLFATQKNTHLNISYIQYFLRKSKAQTYGGLHLSNCFVYLKQHYRSDKLPIRKVITAELPVRRVITDKLSVRRVITSNMPVRRIKTSKLPVRRVITGKLPVRRVITGNLPVRRVITGNLRGS